MKNLLNISIWTVLLFVSSGCIEFNLKVKVDSNGSGTITEEVLFSQKMVSMINSLTAMGGEDAEKFEPFSMNDIADRATEFGEGVELVKAEKLTRKTQSGYSAVYRFKDINKLVLQDDPSSLMPDNLPTHDPEGGKVADGFTFEFKKGNPAKMVISMNQDEFSIEEDSEFEDESESQDEENEMMFQQMKDMMKDMRTSIILEIDGKILETTASHVKGNKITLIDLDFGKLFDMPEKLEEFKKFKPKSFEEAKKFLSGIPGFKIEFNDEISVKFR